MTPCNIEKNDGDVQRAKNILSAKLLSKGAYITRYLRHNPTVGLATVKSEEDADAPYVRKRVICAGTPYACLIAFRYNNSLLIGWSKRMDIEGEESFSKREGKITAVIRALNDTISLTGKYPTSAVSGPIPGDVAKNLPWFINHAEKLYEDTAVNVER